MSEITITARCKIHEGKLDEFRKHADACIAVVKEKDTKTLRYDWYLNEEKMECRVLEKYTDSDGAMEHVGNVGETLGPLLGCCDCSLEIYGQPSEKMLGMFSIVPLTVYADL